MIACMLSFLSLMGEPSYNDYLNKMDLTFVSEYSKPRFQYIVQISVHYPLVHFLVGNDLMQLKGIIFVDDKARTLCSYFVFHQFVGFQDLTSLVSMPTKDGTLDNLKKVLTLVAEANDFDYLNETISYLPTLEQSSNGFMMKLIDYKPGNYHHIIIKGEFAVGGKLKSLSFDEISF